MIGSEKFIPENELSKEKREWPEIKSMTPRELTRFLRNLEEVELQNFLEDALEKSENVAILSYWQKWFGKKISNDIDFLVREKKKLYDSETSKDDFETLPLNLEKRFTDTELKLITSNLMVIQLSFGCSFGCPFCSFDAIKGAREHIKYTELSNLFSKYGPQIKKWRPFLYWASDPSDYTSTDEQGEKITYDDIHELAFCYAGYKPHITTRKFDEDSWLEFLIEKATDSRISINDVKAEEIEKIKPSLKEKINTTPSIPHYRHVGVHYKGDPNKPGLEKIQDYSGSGCVTGVIMTPRGIYNILLLNGQNERYPQGFILTPIENLSRKKINVGDHIEDVMRTTVLKGQRFNPTSLPGSVSVCMENKIYWVHFDINGLVTAVKENAPGKEYKDAKIDNPLITAVKLGNLAIIRRFTQKNQQNKPSNASDLEATLSLLKTEIPFVAPSKNIERIIPYLINVGMDINAKNEKGQNALHLAYQTNNIDWIKTLIENGIDTEVIDHVGKKPIEYSFKKDLG